MKPLNITIAEHRGSLTITWDDGQTNVLPTLTLREECPCAPCQAEKSPEQKKKFALPTYKAVPEGYASIDQVALIGNYALSIKWADGHATGIYPFPLLRRLSTD